MMKNIVGWMVPDFDRVIAKQCRSFPETSYQQDILDWAISNIKSFNLAVDVGANVGLHSVRFAQKFLQVESFEPFFGCGSLNNRKRKLRKMLIWLKLTSQMERCNKKTKVLVTT